MVVMIQLKAETAIAMQTEIQQLREKSQVSFTIVMLLCVLVCELDAFRCNCHIALQKLQYVVHLHMLFTC
jgi:hypothetical protein